MYDEEGREIWECATCHTYTVSRRLDEILIFALLFSEGIPVVPGVIEIPYGVLLKKYGATHMKPTCMKCTRSPFEI